MNHSHLCPRAARLPTITLLTVLLLLGLTGQSAGQVRRGETVRRSGRPIPGRYVVVLRPNGDPQQFASEVQSIGRGRVRRIYRDAVRGFAVEATEAVARDLANDPRVAFVEQDRVVEAAALQSLGPADNWGLDRIDHRGIASEDDAAYDGIYHYSADGSGVQVYVIDTGIRTSHVEFGGRAFSAFDVIGDGVTGDCHGHGTHVAGIVGGTRFGVAKNVTLHSVRALACDGYGSYSGVTAAIDWVTANHMKPAVISMSIGGWRSESVDLAIRGAIAAGVTFVGAAGNDNDDGCNHLMGGAPDALVVAASGYDDRRESYSNVGTCVDIFAPGGNILSAYTGSDDNVAAMSGTSMATPHVAGAAALYLQQVPTAPPLEVATAIVDAATQGAVIDEGSGSPNRLLFTAHFGDAVVPTIALLTPVTGTIARGQISIVAAAQDDVEVRYVAFYAGQTWLGSDSTAPYSIEWNTLALPDGAYEIRAVAFDWSGNRAVAGVPVTVRNTRDQTPPRVTVTTQFPTMRARTAKLVPVRFVGTVADDVSTITNVSFAVKDEYGRVEPSGRVDVTNGRFAVTVYLEPSRGGADRDGRAYVMNVAATDQANNSASAAARTVILHDTRR